MTSNGINRISDESSHGVEPKTDDSAFERIDNVPKYKCDDTENLRLEKKVTVTDPVFGEILEDGPNYRNVYLP